MSGRPGWLLDELKTAGRENLEQEHALRYDAKEDAAAEEELRLLERLGLNVDSVLVELGAGTGQFSVTAASTCGRLVAVDVSQVMLGVLRAKIRSSRIANLEIVRAGFLTYEHEGTPADFVYSRFALHHLPDFWKALALIRIRSYMRPGGVLRLWDIVYNFEAEKAEERLETWCQEWEHAPEGGWNRADVEEHIRDEHSTFTWLLEPMLERSGFAIEEAEYSADGLFAKYIARAE